MTATATFSVHAATAAPDAGGEARAAVENVYVPAAAVDVHAAFPSTPPRR